MAPSSKKGPMKQGTLFSFFAKKPEAPTNTDFEEAEKKPTMNATTGSSSPHSNKSKASSPAMISTDKINDRKKSKPKKQPDPELQIGSQLEIFWPDDKTWYKAVVREQRGGRTSVEYEDDGTEEWVRLNDEQWRAVPTKGSAPKRRRILEPESESDEEMEFDDASDDESAFEEPENNGDDDDEEDEENWIVPDDEEEVEAPKKKKKSALVVKPHPTSSSTPASKRRPVSVTTVSSTASVSASSITTPKARHGSAPFVTPPSACSPSAPTGTFNPHVAETPLPFTDKALNAAGAHVHNHLNFLRNPVDAAGRPPTHADYDPRTLRIVQADWKKIMQKPMTDAVLQWWDLKSQYFDTVLLFKTGKFYEMFHMDADVGVRVCGLKYMKGAVGHAGFPEVAYGENADKLVRAGYKVARVEQTETPAQLSERKQQHKKLRRSGTAPKVVNREVCSVLSLGTRTFCYLDERSSLEQEESSPTETQTGPLLAIREVVYDTPMKDSNSEDDNDTPSATCEYGITLVDAIRGSVTLGQFADDVLRSRMQTLLTSYNPCEILLQGGAQKASSTLESLIKTYQRTAQYSCRVEIIRTTENAPRSTALDPNVRKQLERSQQKASPWDVDETLDELHRRQYYPRASKQDRSVARWPQVLQAVVQGEANLALSSFGAVLFYLQRNLIDSELLSMGIVKAYVPPSSSVVSMEDSSTTRVGQLAAVQDLAYSGVVEQETDFPANDNSKGTESSPMDWTAVLPGKDATEVNHMALDGTTLHNLEILYNTADGKVAGSLWSKINHTKTPHGSRLLRAWLLRPLFRKADIDRRAEAVEELVSGGAAVALGEARAILAKCGDIERLLSRVHSMSGTAGTGEEGSVHPNDRAVLYEQATYTKRKVGDFSRVLNSLREASRIPTVFSGLEIHSGLLAKIVKRKDEGGRFPDLSTELDFFSENFDCDQAAKGEFEPARGIDSLFDESLDTIDRITSDLNQYKKEMCSGLGGQARATWKYINTERNSKDKYLIELPASVRVPADFHMVGKRGKGIKQVNKYLSPVVQELVNELEAAYDVQDERRARGLQLIFAKFDSSRDLWALVAHTTAMLDALGSLATASSKPGYTRPTIIDSDTPLVSVTQGRHPCIESSMKSEFIPNDLSLGTQSTPSRVLLLSGPNMGGKSTILRQTCLISILAQVGSFVPAESCQLTPVDRIFTRLGASDRILMGQSTFFVELAETAAALRGATSRSLVIMDELGRGTSTFDGQAIASATIKHLVERSRCLTLFATHYHALLEEWKDHPMVRLGHMECLVENGDEDSDIPQRITFLYTLGDGISPKSFGINVARLAGIPESVLSRAKEISCNFEAEVSDGGFKSLTTLSLATLRRKIESATNACDWEALKALQKQVRIQRQQGN